MGVANKLVLGGHSFIRQLGNDPEPSALEAERIVGTCLDSGITWFDTTYAPERTALGKALADLGRRDEASVIAWNFFRHFGPDDSPGGHEAYREGDIDTMLRELRTDRIDLLVVHPVEDPEAQDRQTMLAAKWLDLGKVRRLGTWMPPAATEPAPYSAVFAPYNVTTPGAPLDFEGYKARGWETFATSPFVRGWALDQTVLESGRTKAEVAAEMLRYTALAPNVDRVAVAMRRVEWIRANIEALA